MRPLRISHAAYPDRRFDTPSGKVELSSDRAAALGLPALPVYEARSASVHPLALQQGRTLTHFHGFYDHGRALPTLARVDPDPRLWISPRMRPPAKSPTAPRSASTTTAESFAHAPT